MSESNGPILVFGSPRSGTTWLAKILDAHPRTFYSHEPDSALPPDDVPLFLPLGELERYRDPLARWAQRLEALRSARVTSKLPLFPKSYRNPVTQFLWWSAVMGSKAAPKRFKNIHVPAFASRSALDSSSWLWKSIESLGRLGALARTIEGCRAILLVRHPCGVVSSILRGESRAEFTSQVPASEDGGIFELLAETSEARARGLDVQAFLDMEPIERLTWRWALTNEKAMNDTSGLPNVLQVRYEDLCSDPIGESRRILDFANLSWHGQVKRFVQVSTSSERSAYFSVYKNPFHSVNRWREEMSDHQIRSVERIVSGTSAGQLFNA